MRAEGLGFILGRGFKGSYGATGLRLMIEGRGFRGCLGFILGRGFQGSYGATGFKTRLRAEGLGFMIEGRGFRVCLGFILRAEGLGVLFIAKRMLSLL